MKIQVRKNDIVWSYLGSLFQYCTSLFILPLILNGISKAELGLWYSFASVATLVTYLDFGFSTTMVRNITYAWSGATKIQKEGVDESSIQEQADFAFIKKIIFSCRMVCFVIALVALAVLLTGGTAYVRHITYGVVDPHTVQYSWLIYSVAVFLNVYYNFYGHTLKGIGKISEYQKIVVFSRLCQILISFLGIQLGYGLVGLSTAYLAVGLIIGAGSRICIDKSVAEASGQHRYPENREPLKKKLADVWQIFTSIWYNAKKTGLISLCSYGINQSLTVICSLYLGVEQTAPYGLCKQLITAIMSVAGIMFATYQPKMINCMVRNQAQQYRKIFSMCMTAFGIISIGGILALAVLSQPLLRLIGSDTELPVGMLLFMGLYMYLEHNHGEYTAYFTMRNNLEYMRAYIISSVLIVVGSWVLAAMGCNIYILMLVHFLVQICYNNWFWPAKAMKLMNTNVAGTVTEGTQELWKLIKGMLGRKRNLPENGI